jgi:DNA-binding PadR family transcriptional regulator
MRPQKRPDPAALTTPDLVVLSLLAEEPRHGYGLNLELERRGVREWAGISRPQVYYSLNKLRLLTLVRPARGSADARPDRVVYSLVPKGRRALRDALERDTWATQRPPPPFLTWLALSPHARPGSVRRMVQRRRAFLESSLAREKVTLEAIRAELGPAVKAPELMVLLTIRQFELELAWLVEVERALRRGVSTSAGRRP